MSTEIKYGGYRFSLCKLYRLSPHVDNPEIARQRVWVNRLVHQHGCDWLEVRLAQGDQSLWLVKPSYVLPDNL